jgi:thymidylate synthase ThyX
MAYEAKIILDSLAPNGSRLTTFEVTYPRCIHSEIMTHRMFSRNSASSRAIPVEKMIEKVLSDPFIPIYWGKNQKGMQASEELSERDQVLAEIYWEVARDHAVQGAYDLLAHGVHKQITNRLLEPFLWHTAIISATDYGNFFSQRCHPDAQPEIRRIAEMMQALYNEQEPKAVEHLFWHCPYITEQDTADILAMAHGQPLDALAITRQVSIARCARVSYLAQDGVRCLDKDRALYLKLAQGKHLSPFEHVAMASFKSDDGYSNNFRGWFQFRSAFDGDLQAECGPLKEALSCQNS